MPTVNTNMTEMKAARVDRISLVSKAASRIPFRVIKEDRSMTNPMKALDLAQVFKGKKATPVPTLVGIVTMKGDHFDAVKELVKKAGFKVDQIVENADGSVVLKQADVAEGDKVVVIKMSDDVAITMKGFAPYNCNIDVTGENEQAISFAEMCQTQGFYPDVSTVMDVLQQGVMQAAYKADDPASAAENVAKMFDEAKAYAVSLMSALPAAAFKMEKVAKAGAPNVNGSMENAAPPAGLMAPDKATGNLGGADQKDPQNLGAPNGQSAASGTGDGSQVAKGAGDAAAAGGDEDGVPSAAMGKKKPPKAGASSQETGDGSGAAQATHKGAATAKDPDGDGDDDTNDPEDKKDMKKRMSAMKDELTGLLSAGLKEITTQLTQAVGQVQKSVDGVKTQVEGLSTKVGEVEGVAKAAQQAVKGTVLGSDAGADATTMTQKSEQGYRGREIDTAYAPRRRAAR